MIEIHNIVELQYFKNSKCFYLMPVLNKNTLNFIQSGVGYYHINDLSINKAI